MTILVGLELIFRFVAVQLPVIQTLEYVKPSATSLMRVIVLHQFVNKKSLFQRSPMTKLYRRFHFILTFSSLTERRQITTRGRWLKSGGRRLAEAR